MGRVEPGRIDEHQGVHGWLGCGDVEVLDHEHQLCRLGWRRAPAQIGGQVSSANPLTGMLSWDRLSLPRRLRLSRSKANLKLVKSGTLTPRETGQTGHPIEFPTPRGPVVNVQSRLHSHPRVLT
jgi:hypothetical protein